MDTFYALPAGRQAELFQQLAHKALEQAWGIHNATVSLIKYRENAVFRVIDQKNHKRYAIRIHRFGYHDDAELRSELQWMTALTEAGVETPSVIPTTDGELFVNIALDGIPETHQCDLLGWIEGDALGSIEGSHAGDTNTTVNNYRIVGRLAGQLHNQSQVWHLPEGFKRDFWDIDGMLGENALWGYYNDLEPLTDAQRDLLKRAAEQASKKLDQFGQGIDRYGLIHNDFLPENLLLTTDGIRIIDFDDSGFGWHLFEFATSLFFHIGEDYFDDALQAMVEGYREVRELPDSHLEMLPTFFLVRGLVYLGWVHTRKDTETAQAVTGDLIEGVTALAADYLSETG